MLNINIYAQINSFKLNLDSNISLLTGNLGTMIFTIY